MFPLLKLFSKKFDLCKAAMAPGADPGGDLDASFSVGLVEQVRKTSQRQCVPLGSKSRDYAVGANPGGSETWGEPQVYALAAEIGAPPDPLALKGQGWGIPPQDPNSMLADRLQADV